MISEATIEDVDVLADLFDAYRTFYGRAAYAGGARHYVRGRLIDGPTRFFVEREGEAIREAAADKLDDALGRAIEVGR